MQSPATLVQLAEKLPLVIWQDQGDVIEMEILRAPVYIFTIIITHGILYHKDL